MATQSFFRRHPVLSVLLGLLLLLGLGLGITYVATDGGKKLLPTLSNASMQIGNITPDSLKATMAVELRNNVPVTMRVDSFSYITRLDGELLARGDKNEPTVVKSKGMSRVEVPVNVDLSKVAKKIKEVEQDCVDVQMTMILYTHLPVVGAERIPVTVSKKVYVPKLPKIEVADVDITDMGLRNGEAVVRLRITNYNPAPITIKRVSYRFRVGGDDLDVRGVEEKNISFRKKGTEIVPIRVKFQPKKLPKVVFKTLFRAKQTEYKLEGKAVIAAGKQNPKDLDLNFSSTGTLKELKNIPK
ncbi:Late embryogenesis abundant protein 2 [Hymenobacter roseosalivarius DSM 11622]|uniref:Late embryogenesis abundant protein 2 n=1 Tax=Hymenobacter roseosalivarius DSM 11622 TaxID=645990 RepID=A0A1W1VN39_9BACT|nr:LEA type 2 family protein [Hymenobacter roseosalivarius]SMB94471.1 Late embryogenesis abundant protein 2 [Hymenobacter roseosalivarius DSM 11622]